MSRPGIGLNCFSFGWRLNNNQDGHIRIIVIFCGLMHNFFLG
jgi:hypothetical protein